MRLATLDDGTRDGRLIVVSPDGAHYAPAPVPTLQAALEDWDAAAPALAAVSAFPDPLTPEHLLAPLPRAWQWLDGLRGADRLVGILGRHEHVQVLHGHLHKAVDRIIGLGKSRVFGAPATVEDDDSPRVRLYDVRDGQLESVGLAS